MSQVDITMVIISAAVVALNVLKAWHTRRQEQHARLVRRLYR